MGCLSLHYGVGGGAMAADFSPFQPDIFQLLAQGDPSNRTGRHEWFVEAIAENYAALAERYGCEVSISERRTLEAQKYWMQDLTRVVIEGGSSVPDHLKQAGFLAFWLRRRVVVDSSAEIRGAPYVMYQDEFLQYSNDWLAFLFGFQLCLYFEADPRQGPRRRQQLQQYKLDPEYLRDVSVLLNHKNVSPHALYIIYRSLFYPFRM